MRHTRAAFEEQLGFRFSDRSRLLEALTHVSYPPTNPRHEVRDNALLGFLGQGILDFVVREHLYRGASAQSRLEDLEALRVARISRERRIAIGHALELREALIVSPRFRKGASAKDWDVAIESGVLAIIGALFLDQGMGACRLFIDTYFHTDASRATERLRDPRAELHTVARDRWGEAPHYRVVSAASPVSVEVWVRAIRLGAGSGANTDAAEQHAAATALRSLLGREAPAVAVLKRRTGTEGSHA